ncbi:ATP-binding cassette domain-containing protein [Streptomyces sp. PSKA54]|uniref:ATP-binding cassette domain-containing protein n=1 Tax=Streptomyces himalayensis subsp. aureolus TaxID=2758039 RepID=A0A7W2D4K7_9ACTN|nr:ATP-binding cassette domain-containing protein [Streptomyces himalayensis]MBA4864608.1 ATP-binding cassette domain-containing protein [Streptomyces himalayensis subsp. aureolus]
MSVVSRSNLARAALGPLAAAALIAVLAAGAIPPYQAYSIGLAAVYTVLVLSLNLLAGWAGIWSIAHPAFFAMGAYFAAYGSTHGWSLEAVVLGATACSAAFGAFLGSAGARFSMLYVALLTLAFTMVSLEVMGQWTSVTGGDQGIPMEKLDSALGLGTLSSAGTQAQYIAVGVAGIALAFAALARPSALRMRLVAAKSHPMAARSVGIAPEAQSALAFAVSAAFAALAGVLLALVVGFVSPDPFSLALAISLIAACVLGGAGTLLGAVVGGAYLTWAPTVAEGAGVPQPILQGIVLIAALLFLPGGVVPFLGRMARRLLRRPAPHAPTLVESPDEPLEKVPAPAATTPEILRLDEVAVTFGGLKALEGASMSVRAGETLAIIGPNGAGKTTLLNVLSGLVGGGRVAGSARYGGRHLLKSRATARRGLGIGRTFQHAETFPELTVLENVLCTRRRITAHNRARAVELLESVGLAHVADRYPGELPFGLHKRLDLARALAEEPRLLVLDEPFGGLDASERTLLARQIVRQQQRGTAIVIIDHVLDDLFAVAHRVVAFDFGRPIGEGQPGTILDDPRVRSSYLGEGGARGELVHLNGTERAAVRLDGVDHAYGGVTALHGVDLTIPQGGVVGVVGANGAGKSTLGRILHGTLPPSRGKRAAAQGLRTALVPEGRALFKTLSLKENLEVAAYAAGIKGADLKARLAETAEWLPPRLRDRMGMAAAGLSGGEQQILAIARALMAQPDLLIVDEPALGLSPAMVDEVYARLGRLAREGMTVVLLEQSLGRAASACHEVVVLHEGGIAVRGEPGDPMFLARAEQAYFDGQDDAPMVAAQG